MNWIKRFFSKNEASSSEISFEGVPAWLESRSDKIYRELIRHAGSLFPDIEDALSKIKKSTASLEAAEPEGRYHLKMVKIGASNRDNMVKQVKMLIENITIPENADVRTIIDFHESAMHSLTVCLENMMKSHQYAKTVFLEESRQVIADVNALRKILDRLIEPFNEKKNKIEAFRNAEDSIKNIINTYTEIETEKKKIDETVKNIASIKEEIQEKQEDFASLKESEDWKQHLSLREELARLENRAGKIESEIDALILPLTKGLNRLKQLSESGRYTLNPDVREGLNTCLTERKCSDTDFFIEFQKIVESDALSLSPDKRDKMVEQIRSVISSLDGLKKDHQDLMNDIEDKKGAISALPIRKEEKRITGRLAELKDRLKISEKELESSKDRLTLLEENDRSNKKELQHIVSIIEPGKRVSF